MEDVIGHITEGVCRPLKVSKRMCLISCQRTLKCIQCCVMFCSCTHALCYGCEPQGSNRAGHCGRARRCPSLQAIQPAQVLPPHRQVFKVTQIFNRTITQQV